MTASKPQQGELFTAETTWFHVFKAMIDNGDLAELSGSSVKVYLVIKSHVGISTGRSWPALETIAAKAGLSIAQVKRELRVLEAKGYVSKSKEGRRNVYRMREKLQIRDEAGQATAIASWEYIPEAVQHAVKDLKNALVTGDFAGAKIIHIERLQLNFINAQDNAVVINAGDLERLSPEIQKVLLRNLKLG